MPTGSFSGGLLVSLSLALVGLGLVVSLKSIESLVVGWSLV